MRRGASAAEIFEGFRAFRVLCAHRHGPRGAEGLNKRLAATFGDLAYGEEPALLIPASEEPASTPWNR